MRTGIWSGLASGKIGKVMLLGVVTIAMVIPRSDVVFSQSGSGTSSYTFTTINVPNSTWTQASGINNKGQIVGIFFGASGQHSFVHQGTDFTTGYTTIDAPGASNTTVTGVNGSGQIVGYFPDPACGCSHGFVHQGTDYTTGYTTIDDPGGYSTFANGINNKGQIVGQFTETNGVVHGFLRDVGGTFTTIDVGNSTAPYTVPKGINDTGEIVGVLENTNYVPIYNFLIDTKGTVTTFVPPNVVIQVVSGASAINNSGQIVGSELFQGGPSGNCQCGFLTNDNGKTFTTFSVPRSSSPFCPCPTYASGINDGGQIVGWFRAANPALGFLASKADPRLQVPHWFQAGIPPAGYPGNFWATDTYDDHKVSDGFTIGDYGCALTTLTMLANFWARNVDDPTGFSNLDPRQMNHWTGMYSTRSQGDVEWNNFATASNNNPAAPFVRMYLAGPPSTNPCTPAPPNNSFPVYPDPKQTLDNLLRNGVPVILPIFKQKTNTALHFVVVTGKDTPDNTYFINDPGAYYDVNGHPTIRRLVDLPNTPWAQKHNPRVVQADIDYSLTQYKQWKVYVGIDPATATYKNINCKDPSTAQALGVYSSDPVEFILTDPQGRRTGYDPMSNTTFEEIPTSAYSTAIYRNEQDFSIPDPPPFKSLDMANQLAGQYTLDVIGTGSGNFTVEVRASDAAGNWIAQTYSGTTAPGASSRFTFQGAITAFSAFAANLRFYPPSQAFEVDGTFTLGPGSGAVSPTTQPLTLQLGNGFLATIPAGSFTQTPQGTFVFAGVINGVPIGAELTPLGGNSYAYAIGGAGAPNLPSTNPVNVRLAIGSNGGSTSVNATFYP